MAARTPDRHMNRPPRLQPVWTWLWLAFGVVALVLVVVGFFFAGTTR